MKAARTVLSGGKPAKAYLSRLGQQVNRNSELNLVNKSKRSESEF